ncbi:MAG: SulP family inorganic anion transporter [Methyloligellaceae bacterium]
MVSLGKTDRQPIGSNAASLLRDALAGSIAALVTIAYCISFSALIFQGEIAGGFSIGLAALLTGTAVTGVIVSLTTTLAPADAGPDTPAVAVISVLAASIVAQLQAQGMSSEQAILHVMTAVSVATLLTGLLLLGLGAFKLGVWLRFVPYPVIGGFLAASGWLLITGGIEVMTGVSPMLSLDSIWALFLPENLPQFAIGGLFGVTVFLIRRRIDSFLVLPIAFFVMLLVLDIVLLGMGQAEQLGGHDRWFLQGVSELERWMPLVTIPQHELKWSVLAQNAAEIGAVCGVTAVSMLLDVSSLEVARQKSADLDKELRTNGIANVIAASVGGFVGNLSLNGSILINEAGAASRLSGAVAALICAFVLFVGADIATLVPTPLLGGLLAYLGLVIIAEAMIRSPAQRTWTDLLLAGAIMAVIVYFGYLLGVLLGVVGACLLFAFSYSRIGLVRRHLTCRDFSSNVERAPAEARLLREHGEQVHVLWLSGFIFFGSSNGLFEYVRRTIENQTSMPVRFVILDFRAVPGLDTSAVLSLVKLRNYCDQVSVALVFSGLTDQMRKSFEAAEFFAEGRLHCVFPTRNDAQEWCEGRILSQHEFDRPGDTSFEDWLVSELGDSADIPKLISYFECHELEADEVLFDEGAPSDTVEMIATGCVAITIKDEKGNSARIRRMAGQTVVGEMGFYRRAPRAATILAEQPTVVYRMTREAFERMEDEAPETASAFNRLIIRVLSDRLEFANREITALV